MNKFYKNISNIGLFIQAVFLVCILILAIICTVIPDFMVIVELLVGFTLMLMAYNNYQIYKRKNITWLYLIVGIVILISSLVTWFNAI